MEAKLYLDGIFKFESGSPSSVRIIVPNPSNDTADMESLELVGLMTGDVTFSAQNTWGTVVNDLTNLQDLSSLMGSGDMVSWISASTMCWKGTSPLGISIEFFLINYAKNLNLENKLKTFVKLAAIARKNQETKT